MKVFLSSTCTDLIEHRKAAHDALEQLGLHVIWMEALGARPVESTKACLDEVEESDLFVGIYAHRCGRSTRSAGDAGRLKKPSTNEATNKRIASLPFT